MTDTTRSRRLWIIMLVVLGLVAACNRLVNLTPVDAFDDTADASDPADSASASPPADAAEVDAAVDAGPDAAPIDAI